MAKSAESAPTLTQEESPAVPPKVKTIKSILESTHLTTIPATHMFPENSLDQVISDKEDPVPVIDYSLLVSSDPNQRSQIIQQLAKACQDWGFFKLINHGVSKRLMEEMIELCGEFFELPEEEKQQYEGRHVLDPIRCGTSFNTAIEKVYCWRDFLKIFVHPVFHSPTKPLGFREKMLEYSKRVREVTRELAKGISESLGLEADYIHKALNMDQSLQFTVINYYPPCPQPQLAMGLPAHSDHGVLTLLFDNGISGLQVQHNGKWVNLNSTPNSFLVNTGDHLEILSNGKYKSTMHRAMVNNRETRISIAIVNAPSPDTVVNPAPELVDINGNHKPAFRGMKYVDFLQTQQTMKLGDKSNLESLRI